MIFSTGAIALVEAFFGVGNFLFDPYIGDIRCHGNESRLLRDCPFSDAPDCFHFNDASVLCPSEI